MLNEIALAAEGLYALSALIRTLAGMRPFVQHQILAIGKLLRTEVAREGFDSRVTSNVTN